jgi:hypothetical protein
MKKSKLFLKGILGLLLVFGLVLAGCDNGGGDNNGSGDGGGVDTALVGDWYDTQANADASATDSDGMAYNNAGWVFTFFESDRSTFDGISYLFKTEDGKVTLYTNYPEYKEQGVANYTISGTTLTISSSGATGVFDKDAWKDKTFYKKAGSGNNDITYSVTASGSPDTTALNFTFNSAVSSLDSSNITITGGSGSATKGALSGSGTNWSLSVTTSTAGTVSVSINKSGIESGSKTVTLVKSGGSGNENVDTALVGKWYDTQANADADGDTGLKYTFNSDGSMTLNTQWAGVATGIFTTNSGKISVFSTISGALKEKADYSINGTVLTISNNVGDDYRLVDGTFYKKAD